MSDQQYLAGGTTDAYTPSDLITGDKPVVTKPVVVAASPYGQPRWSVMGVITATGLSTLSRASATDGSEIPDHILVDDVVGSATSTSAPAYFEGVFNPDLLVLGPNHTISSITQGLRDKGIYLRAPG